MEVEGIPKGFCVRKLVRLQRLSRMQTTMDCRIFMCSWRRVMRVFFFMKIKGQVNLRKDDCYHSHHLTARSILNWRISTMMALTISYMFAETTPTCLRY